MRSGLVPRRLEHEHALSARPTSLLNFGGLPRRIPGAAGKGFSIHFTQLGILANDLRIWAVTEHDPRSPGAGLPPCSIAHLIQSLYNASQLSRGGGRKIGAGNPPAQFLRERPDCWLGPSSAHRILSRARPRVYETLHQHREIVPARLPCNDIPVRWTAPVPRRWLRGLPFHALLGNQHAQMVAHGSRRKTRGCANLFWVRIRVLSNIRKNPLP
jgi:hypothetical protein